jgi:CHAD domain-containing protein
MNEGVRRLVGLFHQSLLANVGGALDGSTTEPLHDLRIAIRRIRCVLRAFRKPLRKTSAKRIDDDLRRLNRALGTVRDLDVWIAFCERMAAEGDYAKHRYWPKFMVYQKGLRHLHHATVRRHLRGAGFAALRMRINRFLFLELAAAVGQAAEPIGPLARRAIAKTLRQALKLREWRYSSVPEERHELRIALRRVRYYCGFFEEMLGPGVHKLGRRAQRVERVLGDMRDADLGLDRVLNEGPRPPRRLVEQLRRLAQADATEIESQWAKFSDPKFVGAMRAELKTGVALAPAAGDPEPSDVGQLG